MSSRTNVDKSERRLGFRLLSMSTDDATRRNVEVIAPFPVDAIEHSVHKTYLDSTGRPRIIIKKALCSESHEQNVYVSCHFLKIPYYTGYSHPPGGQEG